MLDEFTLTQRRALAILTVIAVGFGAYFLRNYLVLMAVSAVIAYLFTPLYRRLRRRHNVGLSATMTLLTAIAMVAVPLSGIIFLAVLQIGQMVESIGRWMAHTDLTALGQRVLDSANEILAKVPLLNITVTPEALQAAIARLGQNAGHYALGFARDSVGSIATTLTSAIIFIYVFLALVTNGDKVLSLFRNLNPLGHQVSDIYLAKIGAMVTATVRGQFIIAACQGLAGAASLYIAGIHDGFFMFAIFLTTLSFIPLGSGIVTIPLGIGMALFGNVVGGVFVVLFHLIVVTSIDNALRPFLVPQRAHLNPALMLLSVFAGLRMFGFWGIVLGPVLMIVIVTTISVYLAVYKGAPMEAMRSDDEDDEERETPFWKRLWPFGKKQPPTARDEPAAAPGEPAIPPAAP